MQFNLSKFWLRIQKFSNIYVVRKLQYLILCLEVKHIYGPKKLAYKPNEVIVLCMVRDGALYMKSFIKHYSSLGVKHIVFLDNNSIDNTVPIAQNYENITILQTALPFKKYRMAMRHYLITRFAQKNRWALCVDIDELFDYPFSDIVTFSSLLSYLTGKSYNAVVAHMLDMFSDKPLLNQKSEDSNSLGSLYKYYDVSDITKMKYYFPRNNISNDEITVYFGGIRKTIFGADDELGFLLTKHPLFFVDGKLKPIFVDEHDVRNANVADFTCVLFHYKFLNDFYTRTVGNVKEENHARGSAEYKRYLKVLEQNPNLQIKQETSKQLKHVNDLIDERFLIVSESYMNFVKVGTSVINAPPKNEN